MDTKDKKFFEVKISESYGVVLYVTTSRSKMKETCFEAFGKQSKHTLCNLAGNGETCVRIQCAAPFLCNIS